MILITFRLKIPDLKISGIIKTVARGDTLSEESKAGGGSDGQGRRNRGRLHESKFPFVSRIEFIRSKFRIFLPMYPRSVTN